MPFRKLYFILTFFFIYASSYYLDKKQEKRDLNFDKNCKEFLKLVKYANALQSLIFDFEASIKIQVKYFKKFDLIDFSCFDNLKKSIMSISLIPSISSGKIMDKSFKINLTKKIFSNLLTIKIANLNGFEVNDDIFRVIIDNQVIKQKTNLKIYYSYFQFYANRTKAKYFCQKKNLYNPENFQLFKSLEYVSLDFNVKYFTDTCPFIFKGTTFLKLSINGLSDIFINRNVLTFQKNVLNKNDSIYFNIIELSLKFYKINLNEKLLDKVLFKNLKTIKINGKLDKITQDAFNFTDGSAYLSNVDFNLENLNVVLMNSIEWLETINFKVERNITWKFIISDWYSFPDEDICLFKNFPKLANLKIEFLNKNFNCSCTIFWLLKTRLEKNPNELYIKYLCSNIKDIIKCDFDYMFSLCPKNSIFYTKHSYNNNLKIDLISLFETTQLLKLFSIIVLPIFGLTGMITNFLNMIILNYKKKEETFQEFNKPLFRFMFYNSIFNFIYCFISLLHLPNVCLSFKSFLCSSVSKSRLVQYLEIYVVEFLGNIIKTSSNITNIAISLNRFALLENKSILSRILNRIQSYKYFKISLFLAMFLFLILVNIDKIITSFINELYFFESLYDYQQSPLKNSFANIINLEDTYFFKLADSDSSNNFIFFILFIINFVSNDVFSLSFLFIADFMILVKYRSKIKLKIKFENSRNIKSKKSSKLEMFELKITTTILINSFVIFCFRSLEFFLLFFVFWKRITDGRICLDISSICTNFIELGNSFFLISCSLSLFVFYFLNSLFENALTSLKKSIYLKFRSYLLFIFKNSKIGFFSADK